MNQDINVLISEYKMTRSTEALERVLSLVKPLIIKTANSFHTDRSTREDLVQQGYLTVIDSIKTFDLSKNIFFYVYLKKCLYYSLYKMLKSRETSCLNEPIYDGLEVIDTVPDTRLSVEDEAIEKEVNSVLHRAVSALPNKQRYVIVERYFNTRKLKEIAAGQGVIYMTTVMNQQLAIQSLKRALRQYR